MNEKMKQSPERRRWDPWPVSIIAFFTLAIASCAGWVAFCSLHPNDLVAGDYYEQELRYQGQIDRVNRTRHLSDQGSINYEDAARRIVVRLPDLSSGAVSGAVQLYRPSAAGLDRQVKLELNAEGLQFLDASHLLPGLWRVRVSWSAGREEYYLDRNIVIASRS